MASPRQCSTCKRGCSGRDRSRPPERLLAERIGLLDDVRPAPTDAREENNTKRDAGTATSDSAARRDNRRRQLDESRSRASVTCGVYLRPSGSRPSRCSSVLARPAFHQRRDRRDRGDHRARLAPPKDVSPSSRNSNEPRCTRPARRRFRAPRHRRYRDKAQRQ